jgi:hypothetical protein
MNEKPGPTNDKPASAMSDTNAPVNVIVLLGLSGSGKSTAGDAILAAAKQEGRSACEASFAARLKDMTAVLFRWPRDLLEGKTPAARAWRLEPQATWGARLRIPDFTPLRALRLLGTEALRQGFSDRLWLSMVEDELDRNRAAGVLTVITDARFSNELAMLQQQARRNGDVLFLHVDRPRLQPWWYPALAWRGGRWVYRAQSLLKAALARCSPLRWAERAFPHASEAEWVSFAHHGLMPLVRVINDDSAHMTVQDFQAAVIAACGMRGGAAANGSR